LSEDVDNNGCYVTRLVAAADVINTKRGQADNSVHNSLRVLKMAESLSSKYIYISKKCIYFISNIK